MTATWHIGDTRTVLATLPDASVDLVLTSPPFLALRSYLPADDPNKPLEMGSEPTPGEFIDGLLDVVEECRRVLAPHGSLCIELGDTYAGSGGAGGDYAEGGLRDGQSVFDGTAKRRRAESRWCRTDAVWLAALVDAEGSIAVHVDERKPSPTYAPMLSVAMSVAPMVERAQQITGLGSIHQKSSGIWSWTASGQAAREVLLNLWPYLMVKQPQALAAIELARVVADGAKSRANPVTANDTAHRERIRRFIMNHNDKGGNRGAFPDDWEPPPAPRPVHRDGDFGTDWPLSKSLCLIPESFRWALAYGRNPFTGRTIEPWRVRNVVRWCRPNPPVGALADKFRPATSEMVVACTGRSRYFDLDSVRQGDRISEDPEGPHPKSTEFRDAGVNGLGADTTYHARGGAPPLDWWRIPTQGFKGSHYATWPEDLCITPILAMCPTKVCTVCGKPSERITGDVEYVPSTNPTTNVSAKAERSWDSAMASGRGAHSDKPDGGYVRSAPTLGWSDCGHDAWRPGVVLDPFAGSGTTGAVAIGHGRSFIGIDLDERNYHLARERIGMWLELAEQDSAA